jgi:hypothetical protein
MLSGSHPARLCLDSRGRNRGAIAVASVLVLGSTLARPAVSHAQEASEPSAPPGVPNPLLAPTISRPELRAFANLLDQSTKHVEWRLRNDPGLIPVAAAAGKARLARESSGKGMTTLGFIMAGLGATLDFGALVTTFPSPGCEGSCPDRPMSADAKAVAITGLIMAGLGQALAILGIIRMNSLTDTEVEAVDQYNRSPSPPPLVFPPGISRTLSGGSGGKELGATLAAFTF